VGGSGGLRCEVSSVRVQSRVRGWSKEGQQSNFMLKYDQSVSPLKFCFNKVEVNKLDILYTVFPIPRRLISTLVTPPLLKK
jgi:hypothetical protein